MLKVLLGTILTLLFSTSFSQKTYEYPIAPKDSTVDRYFDTLIADPYQWMEDPDDPRLIQWLEEQEKLTSKYSHKQVQKSLFKNKLFSMYDVNNKITNDYVANNRKKSKYIFKYTYNSYKRSPDLFYRERSQKNFKRLVKIKDFERGQSEKIEINGKYVNEEEDLVAVELSYGGSDWSEVYFFDLLSGEQLSDTLRYLRFDNIIWEGRNVYYCRYDAPEKGRELLDKALGQKLYYHKIGESQSEDALLYENKDLSGRRYFYYTGVDDEKFLFHYYDRNGKEYNAISKFSYHEGNFLMKNFLLYPSNDSIELYIEFFKGDTAYIQSNWNAPNGRVLMANTKKVNDLVELIPEYDIILWEIAPLGKNKISCTYRNKGVYSVMIFDLNGKILQNIEFPEGKKVNGLYEYDEEVDYTVFTLSSFYHPSISYQLSLNDLKYKPIEKIWVPYDVESIETRYVNYPSKDGTLIPMYLTCLKKTKLDGNNPVLLYGYGGYGENIEPQFINEFMLWVLKGGILAIPNIRGSGAEGGNWALAGRRLEKQHTIDDFIYAAEYLIEKKYTNPEKIAINGGSHGGMLVGAALTQRPELFKLAIAEAGAFDMLRFENFTVGSVETNLSEFGTVTDSADFNNLLSYSPLHNIKKGVKYPNVILITGEKDDRVPPLHSYKFLATLQEKGDPSSNYMLYVIPDSGHEGALNSDDWLDELLFRNYSIFDELGLRFY